MDGMNMTPPPPSMTGHGGSSPPHSHKGMMHMTFFWGTDGFILFSGWPGTDKGMYVLALLLTFALAALVELLSGSRMIKPGTNNVPAGVVQTVLHAVRMGLAYLVMLALMSFNGGILLSAVAGHMVGFFFFGSRVFRKVDPLGHEKLNSDLPPMSC